MNNNNERGVVLIVDSEAEEIGIDEFLPKCVEIPMLVGAVQHIIKR